MCSYHQCAEWDEYGAAGSSSEYTIRQVISKDALTGQVPMNGSQPDLIFHRAFDAVGPGKMWLSQDAYLPLFGAPDSLTTEVRISQWAQAEGLRCQFLSVLSWRHFHLANACCRCQPGAPPAHATPIDVCFLDAKRALAERSM